MTPPTLGSTPWIVRRIAPAVLIVSCLSVRTGAEPVLIHRVDSSAEANRPREPLDLARIRVTGEVDARLRLSEEYLRANETRLAQDRGWGADQLARWLETMTLFAHYRGQPSRKLDGSLLAFLERQGADGSLFLERGDTKELWGATRSLVLLTTYYQQVRPDARVLDAAVRLADHLLTRIEMPKEVETRIHADHRSAIRGLVALGEITGEPRFLDGARALAAGVDPQVAPPGPSKLVHSPLAGEVMHTPQRAEAFAPHQHLAHAYLESVTGMVELSRVTGDVVPLGVARGVWDATVEHTMWASGGIPEAYGEPFEHNDEACAAVSWVFLNLSLFRVTGDVRYADVAEHVVLNHLYFDQAAQGGFCRDRSLSRGVTVNASNRGAVADECCSMSGSRGVLEYLRYAVTADSAGVDVNFFVPSVSKAPIGSAEVTVTVETDYPASGAVVIGMDPPQGDLELELRVRRPGWLVADPVITLNDAPIKARLEGGVWTIKRKWRRGDRVRYAMELPLAVVRRGENGFNAPRLTELPRGDRVLEGAALLRGPLLLMIDRARSGLLPEGDFRISVGSTPEGWLHLDPARSAAPGHARFVIPEAHLLTGCRAEERRTGPVPSPREAKWDPAVLFPLSEITQQTELLPDEYVVRMNVEFRTDDSY